LRGEKIKNIRIEKGYTLADLLERTGYTPSYLSQIERNLKNPSLEALRKIADSLEVPIITFLIDDYDKYPLAQESFNDDYYRYYMLQKNTRKKMVIPEIGTEYQFITPVSQHKTRKPKMLGFYIELKPKSWVSEKLVTHKAEESVLVIDGMVEVYVDDKVFHLVTGDSFYIDENVPHNIKNPLDTDTIIVVYQSPAMY
jgi:transcriptional regulator with XRE-family HTH domain